MSTAIALYSIYAVLSIFVIVLLFRRCEMIRQENLRILAKSATVAFFLTPTISVPAATPVPAILMLFLWTIALQLHIALFIGLAPIAGATLALFLVTKVVKLFWALIHETPST